VKAGGVKTKAWRKPEVKKPSQSVPAATVHPSIPKPSAAIAKQQANTNSD